MFRTKLKDPNLTLRIGLVLFVLANILTLAVRPSARIDGAWLDGVKGLLYGISIGLLALSMRLRSGQKCRRESA